MDNLSRQELQLIIHALGIECDRQRKLLVAATIDGTLEDVPELDEYGTLCRLRSRLVSDLNFRF
jgi:hypothetical protein